MPRERAEALVDVLAPEPDWKASVRRHPWSSLAAAFAIGVYLGYDRGRALKAAVSAYATRALLRGAARAIERRYL
jgi:hypothetical protein